MASEQMTAADRTGVRGTDDRLNRAPRDRATSRRLSTETKSAFKTTELIAFLVAVAGVLIATAIVDSADAGGLGARQGWTLVTALTIGYLVSRGLAKAGSRDPYTEHDAGR
jgi:hypothetical protein